MILHCDSTSGRNIAKNPVYQQRTNNHIGIDCHFIRERIMNTIKLSYERTADYVTFFFLTKEKTEKQLSDVLSKLGMVCVHTQSLSYGAFHAHLAVGPT